MNFQDELNFAKQLANEAGKIMKRYFRAEDIDTQTKADFTPVTIADKMINDLVINKVREKYPDYGVLGEEASYHAHRDKIWVVDPIDGTVPFSLGMPVSTFSLALLNRSNGQPIVAVTHDPFLNETYTAVKGNGAFLNGRRLQATPIFDFKGSYLSLSSRSYESAEFHYRPARLMQDFRSQGAKILSFVSFVYTANRVASGQLLATIVGETNPWDVAACSLLVMEAGGKVTDFRGELPRFDSVKNGCIMAANQEVLDIFLGQIKT